MKWLHPSTSLLSIALADSQISLYSFKKDKVTLLTSIEANKTKALCLSLDWSDRIGGFPGGYDLSSTSEVKDYQAITSQSDGTLSLLADVFESLSPVITTWRAHEYEAWTSAYDCWSAGNIVWSGGDDLCLRGWDLREQNDLDTSTFTVKKCFEGGVTSMQSHHLKQHLWAVGR
jgi:diphthamide biosynthesis protein 7